MNVLQSPVGAVLARPWVDRIGLAGAERWYLPLSRLWAAANAAGDDPALFRESVGMPRKALPDGTGQSALRRNAELLAKAGAARRDWEAALFGGDGNAPGPLDRRRRHAATWHLSSRALFYPLSRGREIPTARWHIDAPDRLERVFERALDDPTLLYDAPLDAASVDVSPAWTTHGRREYWLRAATPSLRLRARMGSERLYARVVEPAAGSGCTLILGSGLCLENDLWAGSLDTAGPLVAQGWRVIEPVSPYHGLRTMAGYYGGEPFFALAPTAALDLISGQALETGLLTAWCRSRFAGNVAVAGMSLTSFVAQQVAGHCGLWPAAARPDAVMLISHSAHIENVAFGGTLAAALGLGRALADAGWSREALARLAHLANPTDRPALEPGRIVSVLGETDRWVPCEDGEALARRWRVPDSNVFRYPLGHLGMPVQLLRDRTPFARLRQVMEG